MKALVGAFNQEKALVGAFSVIVQPVVEPMEYYTALVAILYRVMCTVINIITYCDRNSYLWTPLSCAAAHGWVKCVKHLIRVSC